MNLAEKMARWEALKREIDALEEEIKAEVLSLRQTQKVGAVVATYSDGRGSYDYEQIARMLEPDQEIVDRHTKTVTDWRKVCEEAGMTDDVKTLFYKPGSPSVSIKLKDSKND